MMATSTGNRSQWFSRTDLAALFITLLGFLARLWTAHGTFLNPDEALHFRLANQASLALAYKASLTASHPPLLTFVLYFWRALGSSELWLRLPSVLAGVAFCWTFYKWLSKAAGNLAGLVGLLLVAFLPPIVQLAAEVRQYSLLLAFLASALYFLDAALAKNSPRRMAAFSLCLYFAMLTHYSAFLFAAALGLYTLLRISTERPPARLLTVWALGQLGALALAIFLYKSHLSTLGAGESRTPLQGWMSDFYLRHSYFDPSHDNPLTFLVGHSFGVFQYFFGQLAVGDAMGLLFVVGVALLLRAKGSAKNQTQNKEQNEDQNKARSASRQVGLFLLLPFAIAAAASLAHVYPYGGTRHVAFLIIPGAAGVSLAIARLAAEKWLRALTIAAVILVTCIAFGKPRAPRMDRADQSRTHMSAAMEFVSQKIDASDLIFTDYQSDLVLGHYLCRQQPIVFESSSADFEAFTCGHRVISAGYKTATLFTASSFLNPWNRLVETCRLNPGKSVWVFQTGWDANLPKDLRKNSAELHDLRFESFGNNIKIFKLTVGQPMPALSP
jgi:4-amino-4-deoxy-L-arabinose transferase-like glycosyltransferase